MFRKILILGATVNEGIIVKRVQELGFYAIVTDYNTDWTKSPAKELANESWNISWSDIDSLVDKCKESRVAGVLAGFSEFRIENQIKLCERLNLPCNITIEQLAITRDKVLFKELCVNNGVPIVPAYDKKCTNITFPAIVKPVDRAGSIGIKVVYTKDELAQAVVEAEQASPTGNVIIEKYMVDCVKFDVYYLIINGDIHLIATNDTFMCPIQKGHEIMQSAWLFPSKYERFYVEKVDENVRAMLKNIGIKDGYITISAFVDSKYNFYIFESGFRLSGELSFKYVEKIYEQNYLDFFIYYSTGEDVNHYVSDFKLKQRKLFLLAINFYGKNGHVSRKLGLEKIDGMKDVDFIDYLLNDVQIVNNSSLLRKIAMCFIYDSSLDALLNKSLNVVKTYDVLDAFNKSLNYYKFQAKLVNNELVLF